MDIHHILQIAGGVIGFSAYLALIAAILKDSAKQSFAAFLLWGMLDAIATITTMIQGGNFWLPLSNVVGSITITVLLIAKKQVSWSWIETMTGFLVVVCLTVWYVTGETAGIIASSLAVLMASIPQMVETYRNPKGTPLNAYLIFLTANVLSFFAGRSWTIEERFYAGCSVLLCLGIVVLSRRKRKGSASSD